MQKLTWDVTYHGLLESRTGNFNITVKKAKTDALISERFDLRTYFFFKRKVCYSAIDVGTFQNIPKNFRAQFRAGPERGINLESSK